MMTKDEAAEKIQAHLVEMSRILMQDVMPLAREHQIEFQFLDMQYHLFPRGYRPGDTMEVWKRGSSEYRYVPRPMAKEGLLVSDDEWESSSFGCSSQYLNWECAQWPEQEED